MLLLDHIAVLGETLEEAVGHVEAALGIPMEPGGKHAHFSTHNKLLGLGDGLYVEAIANDPTAPPPSYPRWFGLDHFKGTARLDKWICRVADMDAALKALQMAGRPVELSRGSLRWTMAVPPDGMLPFDGLFPALIQWHSPVSPGNVLSSSAISLDALRVTHREAERLQALLDPYLEDASISFHTGDAGLAADFTVASQSRLLT